MTTSNEHNNAPAVPQDMRLVPVWLLERVERSLGAFTSDEGWAQTDMDTMDSVSAMLAAAPASAPAQEPVTLTPAEIDRAVLEATGFDGFGCQPMNTHDTRNIGLEVIAALRVKGGK